MTEVLIKNEELEAGALRRAMGRFATGITIISAQHEDEIHAMTANAVCTISFDPLMMMVCVNKKSKMNDFIQKAGCFAINILTEEQEIISRHFAGAGQGRAPDGLRFEVIEGTPFLDGTLAGLACEVDQALNAGDHSMILGKVSAVRYKEEEEQPLVYYRGRYRRLEHPDADYRNSPKYWLDSGMRVYYEEW
jgi:flavin reductase (DIM6/NTAB) family NADH-FMN oxidoreductase RutF